MFFFRKSYLTQIQTGLFPGEINHGLDLLSNIPASRTKGTEHTGGPSRSSVAVRGHSLGYSEHGRSSSPSLPLPQTASPLGEVAELSSREEEPSHRNLAHRCLTNGHQIVLGTAEASNVSAFSRSYSLAVGMQRSRMSSETGSGELLCGLTGLGPAPTGCCRQQRYLYFCGDNTERHRLSGSCTENYRCQMC